MWSYEHEVETSAPPRAVWQVYLRTDEWPQWNGAVERIQLEGAFTTGQVGTLTPPGQEPLPFRVVETTDERGYVSETDIAETVTMRVVARLEPVANGTRIAHRVELVGPAADNFGASFGGMLAQGVPGTMSALSERAERFAAAEA